jgi:hypothetical protein
VLDGAPYPRRSKFGAARKYPWDELEVGETFVLKDRKMSSMASVLYYANQSRAPKKFRSRTVGADLEIRRVR